MCNGIRIRSLDYIPIEKRAAFLGAGVGMLKNLAKYYGLNSFKRVIKSPVGTAWSGLNALIDFSQAGKLVSGGTFRSSMKLPGIGQNPISMDSLRLPSAW